MGNAAFSLERLISQSFFCFFVFFNGAFHYFSEVGFSEFRTNYVIRNAPQSLNFGKLEEPSQTPSLQSNMAAPFIDIE